MERTHMHPIWRISGYGLLTWLIPFIVAVPFYSPDGTIRIDPSLFKSVMVVTGSVVGAALIVRFYQRLNGRYVYYGILSGIVWLFMNWILDLIILVPLSGLDLSSYFAQIGLRYLMIPAMTVMAGLVAQQANPDAPGT